MISSIRHRGLKVFYEQNSTRGIPDEAAPRIRRMLTVIDTANSVEEIGMFPGWRLHPLRGELDGYWSLTVTRNWRLIFKFEAGDASELDFVDYH